MIYNTSSYKLIYIFTIADEAHKGMLKIGDATIKTTKTLDELTPNCPELLQAADQGRIKDYTFTAGIKVDLLWAQLAIRERKDFYGGRQITVFDGFRDHDVHNVLKNSGIKTSFPNGVKNREWFECDLHTAKNAIQAVLEHREFLSESEKENKTPTQKIVLREEQQDAVDRTLAAYRKFDKMLWNAKMRFGKTLTAYELVRAGKYQKTIVVTHRPIVEHGWEDDHSKLFGSDSQHVFMKKQNLVYTEDYFDAFSDIKNDVALHNASARGDCFTYFASMQDLRGSQRAGGKFNKNNAVFDMDWDLIIYDEAHEGTQTELGQTVQELLESPKNGKKPKVLELSGTPYNILDKYEDNVFVWDYVMEQEAKQEWAYKHPCEPNPYEDMPRMNIFTFDMSKALSTSYRFESETTAFNFREFFRVYTGDPERDFGQIPFGKSVGDFVHETDVKEFLNIISTDSPDTKYPFATDEYRKEFKHTFWIVPGVAAARALSAILQKHPVFSHYKIVNVAGEGDVEMPYDDAYNAVQQAIAENPYTITLSCGKLTTGVTVREWTAVMMLTGSATTDAKGYMQTIFRVQSAGYIDGKQKENCYVFDFAPDKSLRVVSEAHRLSRKGKNSDEKYKEILGKFLNYCPIYAIEGVQMREYSVNTLMRQIKRISLDSAIKSGFEDDSIYKVDAGMVMDERDREFFEALKSRLSGHKKSTEGKVVPIADNGMTQAEYEQAKKAERKPKKDLTPEEKAALDKLKEQRKQRQAFLALLRNISIRLPLLIFGADVPLTDNITMEDFVNIVDDESWKEFLPADVTKDLFRRSIKYFDEDVLIGAGLRIRRLVKQADEYPPTERIRRITELFNHFRNPDKETVLTPWRVVNMHLSDCIGGYCFLNEQFDSREPLDEPRFIDRGQVTADLFKTDSAKVLEINSKSGLYPLYVAYSIYRYCLPKHEEDMTISEQYAVWNKVLYNNIFVLCKTKMAQDITRRTLAGFTKAKVNTHYQPHLLERMKDDMDWVVKKLNNPAVWGKEGITMKFDAIVGNPPYQLEGGSGGSNDSPTYQEFAKLGENLSQHYTSLIMPSRWFAAGRENLLGDFRSKMMNNRSLSQLIAYADGTDVFSNVEIKGGICYYLIDKQYNGLCNYTLHADGGTITASRDLSEFDIIIRHPITASIVKKIISANANNSTVDTIISNDTPFGISSNPKSSKKNPMHVYEIEDTTHNTMLFHIEKLVRKIEYIDKQLVTKNKQDIDKYKVFIPGAGGSGTDSYVLGKPEFASRNSVCSQSYLYAAFDNEIQAKNFIKYIGTRLFRLLVSAIKISQSAPNRAYRFVPMQDFSDDSDIDWSVSVPDIDKQLYAKYKLSPDEISFIETMIKSME